MTSKLNRRAVHRAASGVLVAALTTLTVGVGLAGPAGAGGLTTDVIALTPNATVTALGTAVTIVGTDTLGGGGAASPTALKYQFVGGPSAATDATVHALGAATTAAISQSVTPPTAGVNVIRVFDDINTDGVYTSTAPIDPSGTITLTSYDPATSASAITQTAGPATTVTSGTATPFTATVTRTPPTALAPVSVSVTETVAKTVTMTPLAITGGNGGETSTQTHDLTGSLNVFTDVYTGGVTTSGGLYVFNVASTAGGVVSVTSTSNGHSATSSYTSVYVPTTSLSQSPSSATTAGNVFTTFTDTSTAASVGAPIIVTVSETIANGPLSNPLTITDANNATINGQSAFPGTPASTSTTLWTDTYNATTSATVPLTFNVTSSIAGSVTVRSESNLHVSTSTLTISGGGLTSQNDVQTVSASANTTAYAGASPSFTVTALDKNGNPVSTVPVFYIVTSGPDKTVDPINSPSSLGATNSNGKATGTIHTGSTIASTDSITFFVNHDNSGSSNPGLDVGEPSVVATATFLTPPTVTAFGLTHVAGTNTNVNLYPSGTSSIPFTATATKTVSSVVVPAQGVVVFFSVASSVVGSTPSMMTGTTGTDGTATVRVVPPSSVTGSTLTVTATDGITSPQATVLFADSTVATLALTPTHETVAIGGTVALTATVTDQFGTGVANQVVQYTVGGRNIKADSVKTGPDGTAPISYADSGAAASASFDTINATDLSATPTNGAATPVTVGLLTGSATPSVVTLTPPTVTTPVVNAAAVATNPSDAVSVIVTNSVGETLFNQSVTFKVDKGFVGKSDVTSTTGSATYVTTTTGTSGAATAFMGSTTAGLQTVTATVGSLAPVTASRTYLGESPSIVTLTPASTVVVVPGVPTKFTAAVTDKFGNVPVWTAGTQSLVFVQSGAGSIGTTSTISGPVDPTTGVVAITLTTVASDTGGGSIVVSDAGITAVGSTPTATSAYTLTPGVIPPGAKLVVDAGSGTVGGLQTVTATLTKADGTPASNELVLFTVTGKNVTVGSGMTDATGVARFTFKASNAGADTVSAVSLLAAAKPDTATVAKGSETPSLNAASHAKHQIIVVIYTHPLLVGQTIHLYTLNSHNVHKYVGTMVSSTKGRGAKTFLNLKSGAKYKFQARVITDTANYVQHFTRTLVVKVK